MPQEVTRRGRGLSWVRPSSAEKGAKLVHQRTATTGAVVVVVGAVVIVVRQADPRAESNPSWVWYGEMEGESVGGIEIGECRERREDSVGGGNMTR